jgi:NitT/TauT family transport system substrate-binding protein
MKALSTRRRVALSGAIGAAVMVLTLAACGSGSAGGSSSAGSGPAKVNITAFSGSFASLPVYVANRKGFFKQHGIAPNFVTVSSGSAAMQAMLAGSADMANVAVSESLIANSKGEGVKYIVGVTTGSIGELVMSKNIQLPDEAAGYPAVIKDLKGKKIGVSSKGSTTYYELAYLLKQAGLDPDKDVTIVPAGPLAGQVAALKDGQLDGFMSQEPVTTQVTDSKDGRVIFYFYQGNRPAALDNLMTNGVAATNQYISANPTAVKGVHDAVAQADNYITGLAKAGITDLAKAVAPDFPGVSQTTLEQAIMHYQKQFSPVITKANISAGNALQIFGGLIKSPIAYGDVVATSAQGS